MKIVVAATKTTAAERSIPNTADSRWLLAQTIKRLSEFAKANDEKVWGNLPASPFQWDLRDFKSIAKLAEKKSNSLTKNLSNIANLARKGYALSILANVNVPF